LGLHWRFSCRLREVDNATRLAHTSPSRSPGPILPERFDDVPRREFAPQESKIGAVAHDHATRGSRLHGDRVRWAVEELIDPRGG
jgi:hypothetical protein